MLFIMQISKSSKIKEWRHVFVTCFLWHLKEIYAAFKATRDDSALLYKLEGNTFWTHIIQLAHIVLEIYERNVTFFKAKSKRRPQGSLLSARTYSHWNFKDYT